MGTAETQHCVLSLRKGPLGPVMPWPKWWSLITVIFRARVGMAVPVRKEHSMASIPGDEMEDDGGWQRRNHL